MALHFRDRGHDVSVVSLTPSAGIDGVDLHILQHQWPVHYAKTNWQYLLSLPHLWRLIRRLRPDLINAQFVSSNGVLGAIIRPKGCPLVVTAQGSDIAVIMRRTVIHEAAARFALSRSDLILSVSPHLTQQIEAVVGTRAQIMTRQYGVDVTYFSPPQSQAERQCRIIGARSLSPIANYDLILEAIRYLEADNSPLILDIFHDGPERMRLESDFGDLVERHRVRFRGTVDQRCLADQLRKAALYVSMTSSDGASMTLLEAMACGTFPVVSNIVANRDWIEDGVNGFLVPLGDPKLLASRLETAWRDPALRRSAAARNWEIVQQRADFGRNMTEIEAAFLALTARG